MKMKLFNDYVEDIHDVTDLGRLTPFKAHTDEDGVTSFDLIRTPGLVDEMAVVRVYSGTGDIAIWYQSHGTAKLGLFCGGLYVRTLDEDDDFSSDFVKSLWKRGEAEAIALKYTGRDLRAQSVSAIRRMDNDISFFVPVSGDDMGKPVFMWDTTIGTTRIWSYDNPVSAGKFVEHCHKLGIDTNYVEASRKWYLANIDCE